MEKLAAPKDSTRSESQAGKLLPARWSGCCALLLSLAPLAWLLYVVAQNAVDVPYWDQWDFVPILEKSYTGQLTFGDVWNQYHEHRLFFPTLLMLGLAHLTDWNIRYELELNVLLAAGSLGILLWQLRTTARALRLASWFWAAPACSLIVFSISHFQNWLWGWQIQMLLNVLAAIGGLVVLARSSFRWKWFALSVGLGIVATYSFANGILFWPIGLGVLWVQLRGQPRRTMALAGWTVIAAIVLGAYFWHYQPPQGHPSLRLGLERWWELIRYVLIYLGGICGQYFRCKFSDACLLALCCGAGGLAALAWAIHTVLRLKLADLATLLPYLAISAYSVGGALMTGVGRVGFGASQALSSRYCTIMMPMWASLAILLFVLAQGQRRPDSPTAAGLRVAKRSPGDSRVAARWALAILLCLLGASSWEATYGARLTSSVQQRGRNRLLELAEQPWTRNGDGGLSCLFADPRVVIERYPFLLKRRLSAFAETR